MLEISLGFDRVGLLTASGGCVPSGSTFAPTWFIFGSAWPITDTKQLEANIISNYTVVQVGLFLNGLKFCENQTSTFQFNKDLLSLTAWQSIQIPNVINQDLQRVPASLIPNAFATWYFEKSAWGQIILPKKDTINNE